MAYEVLVDLALTSVPTSQFSPCSLNSSHTHSCRPLCCLQQLFTQADFFPWNSSLDSLGCSLRSQGKCHLFWAVFPDHPKSNPLLSLFPSEHSALSHHGICHLKSIYLLVYFFFVCISLGVIKEGLSPSLTPSHESISYKVISAIYHFVPCI